MNNPLETPTEETLPEETPAEDKGTSSYEDVSYEADTSHKTMGFQAMVTKFHEVYGHCIAGSGLKGRDDLIKLLKNRQAFLEEEITESRVATAEIVAALDKGDEPTPEQWAELFDAQLDTVYFTIGLCVVMGWDFEKGFREVQRSNMSKLDKYGQPIVDPITGKVQKGPNYVKPNLVAILAGESTDVETPEEASEETQEETA